MDFSLGKIHMRSSKCLGRWREQVCLNSLSPASDYTQDRQAGEMGAEKNEDRHHLEVCHKRMSGREGTFPQWRQRTTGCGFEDLGRIGEVSKGLRFT